jgi:hypothetical protein
LTVGGGRRAAGAYLTELRNAHLFLVQQDEVFSWFANSLSMYREYYRDGAESPAAFGLLLSAPRDRLGEAQYRWSRAGVQVTTVAVFDAYMSDIPPTVSVRLPASENARKYKSLISQFIDGQISASEFQSSYLQAFKTSEDMLGKTNLTFWNTCSQAPMDTWQILNRGGSCWPRVPNCVSTGRA